MRMATTPQSEYNGCLLSPYIAFMSKLVQLWHIFIYYISLCLFAFFVILFNGFSYILSFLFNKKMWTAPLLRFFFNRILILYFSFLRSTKILIPEFSTSESLLDKQPLIIIANHPSMIDVFLLLEKIPNASCFFKGKLNSFILTERLANLLGFINNSTGIDGVHAALTELEKGRSLIIFPEGTRTVNGTQSNQLKSAYAFASIKSQLPLAVLRIETNSNALCKGHDIRVPPLLPIRVKVKLVAMVFPDKFGSVRELHSHVTTLFHHDA